MKGILNYQKKSFVTKIGNSKSLSYLGIVVLTKGISYFSVAAIKHQTQKLPMEGFVLGFSSKLCIYNGKGGMVAGVSRV